MNSIKEKIIKEIKEGRIKAKNKIYFIAKSFLFSFLIILISIFILYFISLLIFVLKVNNFTIFPVAGYRGLKMILFFFPWHLLFIILFLIIFIEILGKKFSFIYRKPLIYSVLIIAIFFVLGGIFVESFSLNKSFSHITQRKETPFIGRMYKNLENINSENIFSGLIIKKDDQIWEIKTKNNEVIILKITEKTRNLKIIQKLKINDEIVVIGERKEGLIEVFGIKKYKSEI